MPKGCSSPSASSTDSQSASSATTECVAPSFPASEKNGVNLDTLGAVIDKPCDIEGYEKTDYGYIQTDPSKPGPDYLLLIEDPKKMTAQQEHYMRNVELADLIRDGKVPTHLDDFIENDKENYSLMSEGKSVYHMNGENGGYNVKLVNKDKLHGYGSGELEVVYSTTDGKLDLSNENMPTINRSSPNKYLGLGHVAKDVKPYWDHGNTPHDNTESGKGDQSDPEKKAVYDAVRKNWE